MPLTKQMSMGGEFWNRKAFVLITGASRGIGREMAVKLARLSTPESTFFLTARSTGDLQETEKLMRSAGRVCNIHIATCDMSSAADINFEKLIAGCLEKFSERPEYFQHALIVHNAGTVGKPSLLKNLDASFQGLQDYYTMNLFSVIRLNHAFLKTFPKDAVKSRTVVNITSLLAIKPYKCLSNYCIGKASREMFFKCLATEEPDLNVLQYSPGPVDTDMHKNIRLNADDQEIRAMFQETFENHTLLSCEVTVSRLIECLESGNYRSSDHVDFYDRI